MKIDTLELIRKVKEENCEESLKKLCTEYGAICTTLMKKYKVRLDQNICSIIGEAIISYDDTKSQFSTWVWNQCFYKCMRELSSLRRHTGKPVRKHDAVSFEYPEDSLLGNRSFLLDAVNKYLDGDIKATILMRYFNHQKNSYEKIAKKINKSRQTVKLYETKGLKILSNRLFFLKKELN